MDKLSTGAALASFAQTIKTQPEKARAKHGSATARITQGLRCHVAGPHGETIETDMPRAMGGEGTKPNPGWFFRASFASCFATVIAMRAAQLEIALTKIEVVVESEGDHRGILGLDESISAGASSMRTTIKLAAPNAGSEALQELVLWADRHSPVGATVRDSPTNILKIIVETS